MDSTFDKAVEGPRRRPGWKIFKQNDAAMSMAPSKTLKYHSVVIMWLLEGLGLGLDSLLDGV